MTRLVYLNWEKRHSARRRHHDPWSQEVKQSLQLFDTCSMHVTPVVRSRRILNFLWTNCFFGLQVMEKMPDTLLRQVDNAGGVQVISTDTKGEFECSNGTEMSRTTSAGDTEEGRGARA